MAKAKPGNYLIPFDTNGNQMHWATNEVTVRQFREKYGADRDYPDAAAEWRVNEPFDDTLTYAKYARGRSAAYFEFRRTDATLVTVFMTDLDSMMPHIHAGKVTGRFAFQKRGQNYGCTMLEARDSRSRKVEGE